MSAHARLAAVLLAAVMLAATASGKAINSFAGPYIVHVNKFDMCDPGNPVVWTWHLRTTHFNPSRPTELQLLSGNVTLVETALDDTMWLNIILDVRSNNQWKENAFVFKFPKKACTNVRINMPDAYKAIFKTAGRGKNCTVPVGAYAVNDAPVPWIFPNVPIIPYGEYRFRLRIGEKGATKSQCCLTAEAVVSPKAS